jgi:ABC-2 type transport system permease protein
MNEINASSKLYIFLLLFSDELRGFYRSKVMGILWIGMPIISILMHFLQPDAEGFPITTLVGLLVASLGGTLASVMLSSSIVNERNKHIYDLFVIRQPGIRTGLILAKYFAVYACLLIAGGISLLFGWLIDIFSSNLPIEIVLEQTLESLVISMAAMAIACAAGILIGLIINSVPAAAILAIYFGNQMSLLAMLPGIMLEEIKPIPFALTVGFGLTTILLVLDLIIFNKKQL